MDEVKVDVQNGGENVNNGEGKSVWWWIFAIGMVVIIVANIVIAFQDGQDKKVIEEAEKEVKAYVAKQSSSVPKVKSEIIARGDDWAIVIVRHKSETAFGTGACVVGVNIGAYDVLVNYSMETSTNYDLELTKEQIEVMKAEWGFD